MENDQEVMDLLVKGHYKGVLNAIGYKNSVDDLVAKECLEPDLKGLVFYGQELQGYFFGLEKDILMSVLKDEVPQQYEDHKDIGGVVFMRDGTVSGSLSKFVDCCDEG